MATFNGDDLFGIACYFRTYPAPRAIKLAAYPGVNGLQAIDMGGRGGVTEVLCVPFAVDILTLLDVVALIDSYQQAGVSNGTYELIDPFGRGFGGVYLESYQPIDHMMFTADGLAVAWPMRMVFRHLF